MTSEMKLAPTDFELEQAILEDNIKAEWKNDSTISARIAAYQNEQAQFLNDHPFESVWDQIQSRPNNVIPLRSRTLTKIVSVALAIAAMLVVALKLNVIPGDNPQDPNYVGMKGDHDFGFYYQKADGPAMLGTSGITLSEGDKIRFYYSSKAPVYLLILSEEADGKINLYYPKDNPSATLVNAGTNELLNETYALDAYQGTETYIAFYSETSFTLEDAKNAIGKTDSKLKQASFIIRKQ